LLLGCIIIRVYWKTSQKNIPESWAVTELTSLQNAAAPDGLEEHYQTQMF